MWEKQRAPQLRVCAFYYDIGLNDIEIIPKKLRINITNNVQFYLYNFDIYRNLRILNLFLFDLYYDFIFFNVIKFRQLHVLFVQRNTQFSCNKTENIKELPAYH